MRALFGKPGVPLPLVADAEFFSTARPAAGEDGAAVLGGHSGEKAMRLRTVSVIRLKGTFRHFRLSRPLSPQA